ncbi:hypothetical protein PUN28_006902 [Cardiocondyla obscurior]|uniref:Uncharacterized protein n=1 Tax=Cardiocondyla obscurior TaxID=286306 RepID=A0AAW2G2D9_9HYME
MDLVYIPEVLTYGYSRNPQYRDYELPWNRDYFKCTTRKSTENQRAVQPQSKESCHLCKEMKRRNLAIYIRSKSRSDSCNEGIHEEEEESDVKYNDKSTANTDQNKSTKSSRGAEKS